jgi:hypothetical protein
LYTLPYNEKYLEVARMNNENKNDTIVSNEALRGKPYLDIDRVITEGNTNSPTHNKKEK